MAIVTRGLASRAGSFNRDDATCALRARRTAQGKNLDKKPATSTFVIHQLYLSLVLLACTAHGAALRAVMLLPKASLSFRPGPALLICTRGVWGRGNPQKWSNLAVFRGPDPAAGGFWGGLLSPLETGVMRGLFMSGFGVPFRVPWRPFGTPDGRFLGTLRGGRSRSAAS